MPTLHLLFSHNLTDPQEKEAKEILKCDSIKPLPFELLQLWKQIPPEGEIEENLLNKFKDYLQIDSSDGDYVLVQGEFGIAFNIVNWCLQNKRIPIYATTHRIAKEIINPDGSVKKINIFQHIQFRRYKL